MKAIIALVAFTFLFYFSFVKSSFAAISFTISNPVVSNSDEIEVDASISGLISSSCSTSGCYLQAQLRILDESKSFFGYTYNNSDEFVDYFSPSSVDDIKSKLFNFLPTSGAWSGKLKAKNNSESSSYVGPGQYTMKFRRFSGNSTSPTTGDSNTLTITLALATPTPTPTPTSSPSPSSTPSPTATSTPTPAPTKTPSPNPIPIPTKIIIGVEEESSSPSEILGTSSAEPSVLEETAKPETVVVKKSGNILEKLFIIFGILIIITSAGILIRQKWIKQ